MKRKEKLVNLIRVFRASSINAQDYMKFPVDMLKAMEKMLRYAPDPQAAKAWDAHYELTLRGINEMNAADAE